MTDDNDFARQIHGLITSVTSSAPPGTSFDWPPQRRARRASAVRVASVVAAATLVLAGVWFMPERQGASDDRKPSGPSGESIVPTSTLMTASTTSTTTSATTTTTTTTTMPVTTVPQQPPLSFTPVGLAELPDGYHLLWARYEDGADGLTVGIVRYRGPADQPDLVLLLRTLPDEVQSMLDAGRPSWSVNGRTVVSDGEGDGRCLPDVCSVGVEWDPSTYISVMWAQSDTALLNDSTTLESLAALSANLSERDAPVFELGDLTLL